MRINGEAVYGTRAIAPYGTENLRYTSRGNIVYVHILPSQGEDVPSSTITLSELRPVTGMDVILLGRNEPLTWNCTNHGIVVELPQVNLPCRNAWVLKFCLDKNV